MEGKQHQFSRNSKWQHGPSSLKLLTINTIGLLRVALNIITKARLSAKLFM